MKWKLQIIIQRINEEKPWYFGKINKILRRFISLEKREDAN
jgi:hypothetical protein